MQSISTHCHVGGQIVTIENEQLATALLQLSKDRRELILLYYFLGVKEYEEIERVLAGNAEAMNALVKLYTPYIKALSHGDKENEDMVTAKLMKATMRFRLDYEV